MRSNRTGEPSRTSQVVAVTRAGLDRPHSPEGDPRGQWALTAGMRGGGTAALRAHLAARTSFIDDAVLATIGAGGRQVVVVGAGYDDRAVRFRTSGVRFFEVDHPATQADKRHRLERLGRAGDVTFVGVDLTVDDVGAELADAGQDDCATTLFIAEGLLVYLPEAVVRGSLQSLHRRAARGSRLVATLAVHPDGVDSAQAVAAANARRRNPWAEPWRTILTREAHLALLADSGWAATRVVEAPSASGRGVTLLVDAAATPT